MEEVNLHGIESFVRAQAPQSMVPEKSRPGDTGFTDMLKDAIESVNHLQWESYRLQKAVANGENMNLHQAVIMGQKADLSFQLVMQVRNKLLDAYQEISRMQV